MGMGISGGGKENKGANFSFRVVIACTELVRVLSIFPNDNADANIADDNGAIC